MSPATWNQLAPLLWPHLVAVALCGSRFLPVAFLCPLLGAQAAPATVKLSLTLGVAGFLHFVAGIAAPAAALESGWTFAAFGLKEGLFGVSLGMVAALPFDAARMGGRFIDLFRGASAEAALPLVGSRESATSHGLYQLMVAVAASAVGLPLALSAVIRSFGVVKLGAFVATQSAALQIVGIAGTAMVTGLAMGAPLAGLGLATDCVLGLVGRALPQLNLQEASAPVRLLAGGAMLWLGLGLILGRLMAGLAASPDAFTLLGGLSR